MDERHSDSVTWTTYSNVSVVILKVLSRSFYISLSGLQLALCARMHVRRPATLILEAFIHTAAESWEPPLRLFTTCQRLDWSGPLWLAVFWMYEVC
jgi:hypothetical protein